MCGIGGFLLKTGEVKQRPLKRMADLLRHRGPDEAGFYLFKKVGLCHRRLSIIDPNGGKQPFCGMDGQIALVANGEIYNFKELREQLELKGHVFSTCSDCEVILRAYLEFGEDFISKVAGMFAFAIWDGIKQRLILGRDRLGIKPLYYAKIPGGIVFASEIKAIVPFLDAPLAIQSQYLAESLQNQFCSGEHTVIRGVQRILPGEFLVVGEDLNPKRTRYWSPLSVRVHDLGFMEAKERFSDLFETVMVQHMRSDVPYGIFLSSGVDSASILFLLARLQSRKILSFSVGYSSVEMEDELEGAKRMARLFGARHVPLRLSKKQVFSRIPHMVWATDEFMWDYACLPTSFLAEEAGGHSLKVVFTGEGGDEVFGGYGRYRKTILERAVKSLYLPGSGGFRTRGRWRSPWPRRVFGPELKKWASCHKAPFVEVWKETPRRWGYVRRAQYADMATELANDLLVKVDRILMAFGIEGRVPFLDHRIVEFGLSLPAGLKVRPHQGKVFLKKWAEAAIPRDHLWRRKMGFHVPVGEWLDGRFLDLLEERLLKGKVVTYWFDKEGIRALFEAQRREQDCSREIWSIMHFAIWYHLFVEQPGRIPSLEENPLDFIS